MILCFAGVSFVGIFNIPQDNGCKGDALCLWLGETVGRDATIEISGRIQKTAFHFGAKFAGTIPLIAGKLNMQSIELKVSLDGMDSNVRIECTLYWTDSEILGKSQLQFIGECNFYHCKIFPPSRAYSSVDFPTFCGLGI